MRYIETIGAKILAAASYLLGVVALFYLALKSLFARVQYETDDEEPPTAGISGAALRAIAEAAVLGAALGFAAASLAGRSPRDILGLVFVTGVMREAAPVIAALLLVIRVSPIIALRIGENMVQEQAEPGAVVDLARIRYEVAPRVLMCIAAALVVTAVTVITAFGAGAVAGPDIMVFADKIGRALTPLDFPYLALKPILYGTIACIVSCHEGFSTTHRHSLVNAPGDAIMGSLALCLIATGAGDAIFYAIA